MSDSKSPDDNQKLLKFPCKFPIKVVSYSSFELEDFVTLTVHKYSPDMEHIPVSKNISKKGNYLSITVTVDAQSQEQIDNIYCELTANKAIIMVL